MNLNHSHAYRWVHCDASPHMEVLCERVDDTSAADEGILAHELAAKMLKTEQFCVNDYTEEMFEGAVMYRDAVLAQSTGTSPLCVEDKIGYDGNRGIVDCWFIRGDTLYVFDYKFGHKIVDVYMNWQLINNTMVLAEHYVFDNVVMTVVQPRSFSIDGPVRSWVTSLVKLQPYFAQLREAMTRSRSDKALCVTGPHCYKCLAASSCKALRDISFAAVEIAAMGSAMTLPDNVIGNELSILEDYEKVLSARIDGLRSDLEYRIKNGTRVAGYDIKPTMSYARWKIGADELIQMASLLGVDVAKPAQVVTPNQAVQAGLSPDFVTELSERVQTGVKLVKDAKHKFIKIFS